MSLLRTPKQTILNVASFIERLSSLKVTSKTSPEFVDLINASKMTMDGLLKESVVHPVNANERKVQIANVLNKMNEQSLSEQYPKQVKDGSIMVGNYDFSADDFEKMKNSEYGRLDDSTVLKMNFFLASLAGVSNGIDRPSNDPLNIEDNFNKLSIATARWISKKPLLSGIEHKPLSPSELADTLTKLSVNGDYLFDLESGLRHLLEGMNNVFPGIKHMESDILVKLYDQCLDNDVIQVPLHGLAIPGRSLKELRSSDYKLSGDVPYPKESDLRAISGVFSLLEERMRTRPIIDAKGNEVEREDLLQSLSYFTNSVIWGVNIKEMERLVPYAHLDFDSAVEAVWAQNHKRSERFMIVLNGGFPRGLKGEVRGHTNYAIPEAIRAVLEIDSFSENTVSLMTLDEAEKFKLMNIDGVSLFPVKFSKLEVSKLKENWLEPKTSAEYLFSLSIERAYSEHAHKDALPEVVYPEIERHLKTLVPGLSDHDFERMKDAFSEKIDAMCKPVFVEHVLKDELTQESKDKLLSGNELLESRPQIESSPVKETPQNIPRRKL